MAEYDVKQLNISKDGDTYHINMDNGAKADKVANAVSGNLAGLDANGNLTDSGKKPSDFAINDNLKKIAESTSIGAISTKSELDTALDSLLAGMNNSDIYSFMFDAAAAFDVFLASGTYFGTLYKSNNASSMDYSHVILRLNGHSGFITGYRHITNGWTYTNITDEIDALNSKIKTIKLDVSAEHTIQSRLHEVVTSLKNGEIVKIWYSPTSTFSPFRDAWYVGFLARTNNSSAWFMLNRDSDRMYGYSTNFYDWNITNLNDEIKTLNSKFTRVSEQIGDNNYGITVNHYYNGCAHTLIVAGQITQELPSSTRWDIAPSASLSYFIDYVPAYDYDNDAYGYFYTINGRLCFQTRKTITSGRNIRFVLNWV